MNISNKTYIIVGATGGIGASIARTLAEKNISLVLFGSNSEKLNNVYNEIKQINNNNHQIIQLDLNKINNIEPVWNNLKKQNIRIDGLIYCAGIAPLCPAILTKSTEIVNSFNINYFAFIEFARLFARQNFTKDDMGHIIAISSISSNLNEQGRLAYASSKSALETSVRLLAKELLSRNICVNAVKPGIVNTQLGKEYLETVGIDDIKQLQPLGIIETEDICNAILYFILKSKPKTTGSILEINGGIL